MNVNRWAAVAWEQVFVWVRFAILRVCSARRAVILGEPLRALLANRRTEISIGPFCVARRSFVVTDSGSPTPRCNRQPCLGDFTIWQWLQALSGLSCSSSPGLRLNANRWVACGLWTVFVWVRFAVLRVCSVHQAVIQDKCSRCLMDNRRTPFSFAHSQVARRSFVATNLVQPNTALQPTPLVGRSRSGRFYGKACAIYLVSPLQGRG